MPSLEMWWFIGTWMFLLLSLIVGYGLGVEVSKQNVKFLLSFSFGGFIFVLVNTWFIHQYFTWRKHGRKSG